MKNKLLIPHRYKWVGLLIFLPGFAGGIAGLFFDWEPSWLEVQLPNWLPGVGDDIFQPAKNVLTDEISLTLTMAGLLLMSFSSEKQEDEFIKHTRLESLQWAFLVSLILFTLATWVIFNDWYWYVIIFNIIAIPVIFLLRFHFILFRAAKEVD